MNFTDTWKAFNFWGWILSIVCILLSIYSYFSFRFFHIWSVTPSRVFILCLSVLALIMGLIGVKSPGNKIRSIFTILMTFGLIFILFLGMTFIGVTKIKTTKSPDHNYTISFYMINGGAGVSPTFVGYIDGPLWFKKGFYKAGTEEGPVKVTWKNNSTIIVNHHLIKLKKGQIYKGQ